MNTNVSSKLIPPKVRAIKINNDANTNEFQFQFIAYEDISITKESLASVLITKKNIRL